MFDNKCRAKDSATKMWVAGYHVHDKQHYIVQDLRMIVRGTPQLVNAYEVDENTLGRCAHLQDKEERLVYEGDLVTEFDVKDLVYIVKYGHYAQQVGLGCYSGLGFYMERVGNPEHKAPLDGVRCTEICVIGNVYDNPEMLNNRE